MSPALAEELGLDPAPEGVFVIELKRGATAGRLGFPAGRPHPVDQRRGNRDREAADGGARPPGRPLAGFLEPRRQRHQLVIEK
jgi:hypothetical protein